MNRLHRRHGCTPSLYGGPVKFCVTEKTLSVEQLVVRDALCIIITTTIITAENPLSPSPLILSAAALRIRSNSHHPGSHCRCAPPRFCPLLVHSFFYALFCQFSNLSLPSRHLCSKVPPPKHQAKALKAPLRLRGPSL